MTDLEKLQLLRYIAQKEKAPGACSHTTMGKLGGLIQHHGWPYMSLTRAGWAEHDRLSQTQAVGGRS
jgi:hypothetical protein